MQDFLDTAGKAAEEIRAFDWASSELGPMETWPQSLTSTLRLVLASRQPMCFWWGETLLQFHNDAYLPMLGKRQPAIGQPFRELWADVWEDVLPFVRSALEGKGTWMENLPLTLTRNGYEEQTYFTFSYSPLQDDAGKIRGILNIVTETTRAMQDRAALEQAFAEAQQHIRERQEHEAQLKLLNRELAHRMKNTLAMVQSIVSQTLRGAPSLSEASATVSARIQALAKAQDLLTGMNVTAAEISAIAVAAVAPHNDRSARFEIEGPQVYLSAQQALGLSLAIHELATNATKYGALSLPEGRVHIRWDRTGEADFSFDWSERGGPPVSEPHRRGFGSRLTERVVSDLFTGEAKIHFRSEGVLFSLKGKLSQAADPDR